MTAPAPPARNRPLPGLRPALPRLLQSAGLRFAVLFTLVFALGTVVLVAVLWIATAASIDRQLLAAIRADAVALAERWRTGGESALIDAIEERIATDSTNQALYLLTDRQGVKLAGNLGAWPEGVEIGASFQRTSIVHEGVAADARIITRDLGGLRLLVGRDEAERVQLRLLLTEGVVWSLGASLVIALMGAALIRQALVNRLDPALRTAMQIAAGDLARRVPLSGRGDEFDRLAETMNAMLDRIEALMQGIKGVSDAIAHDLRTPIARARSKLEAGLAHARDEGELRAAMEEGIADLDQVSRIFQALLRIAEAEAGARRAAFAPFDLTEMLQDAAEFYSVAAEARDQQLTLEARPGLRMVGDRDLLLQAVMNLLDNAVKFTPEGGRIVLAAQPQGEGWVEVTVADSGPGLAPADRARAGERFFRADASRNTPGSGLGLSLVRAVAALHRGSLELADAKPGADPPGLLVRLRLPRAS
ncbi:MAG: ATP-binding protein [Roseococcus sp.]|nr:ATP-binding protein [Roseococcus sp.]